MSSQVIRLLSQADAVLGTLQGFSEIVTNPELLIGPYSRREALASSRIEGTQASLSDVLLAEINGEPKDSEVAEVRRYLAATKKAQALIQNLPISQRLLLQVHKVLLSGVRGNEKNPGEYRRSPVWIGKPGDKPDSAAFVPPIPKHLAELMQDWEVFVNSDGRQLLVLIQAALMHYQFETIHPFLDGNGRIGRLSINLLLMERGRLSHPLLYLSNYFETHRRDYYAALQNVREQGDIDRWLSFFLIAVKEQANDAVLRSRQLVNIREEYLGVAIKTRGSLPQLVEAISLNPYVTVKSFASTANLSEAGARGIIKRAVEKEWLRRAGIAGRGGKEYWVAPRVLEAMESQMTYQTTRGE